MTWHASGQRSAAIVEIPADVKCWLALEEANAGKIIAAMQCDSLALYEAGEDAEECCLRFCSVRD